MSSRYDDVNKVWDDRGFKAYSDFTDKPVKTTVVWVATIIGVLLALSLIGNALGVANIYWQAEQAKLTVNPRVTKATYGTDNALHNIAYFHDQCNTILADQQNVVNAEETLKVDQATLKETSDPIAQQQAGSAVAQDQTAVLGARDQLSTDVRDYDSKSATQTAAPFKAANLPARITINPSTGLLSGTVECH